MTATGYGTISLNKQNVIVVGIQVYYSSSQRVARNLQWGLLRGSGGRAPSRWRQFGVWGAKTPAAGDHVFEGRALSRRRHEDLGAEH